MRRSSRACGTRGLAFPLIPRTARTADRCRPHGSRAGADGHWDRGGDGCPRGEHRAHHDGPIVAAQSSGTVLAPAPPARGPSSAKPGGQWSSLHRHRDPGGARPWGPDSPRLTGEEGRKRASRRIEGRAAPAPSARGASGGPAPAPAGSRLPRISPRPCRAPVREGSGMTRRRIGSPPALARTGLRTLC